MKPRADQEELTKQIIDKVKLVGEFFDSLRKELDTRQKHEDCSVTLEQAQKKTAMLEAEVKGLFNKPEPKPAKEEKKAEAEAEQMPDLETNPKPEEGVDAEMKDETAQEQPAAEEAK